MANLSQKLAEMHRRLTENTQEEQALVRALNAALNHVDEKLLAEIRAITAQHEARRHVIMNELQLLAGRLCAFPVSSAEPMHTIEDERHHQLPHTNGHTNGNGHANGHTNGATHAPGNWRIAAQNIQDDLDFFSDPPPASH
ncbi:hypothetical protein [Hyphomicrobium sp.]|uniref:hypothetical protein n=1 Tax=Hyphomicrobium sp. TaxID=82 RepID=UPI002E3273A7|nr:hypothetical protein [Hyphomicrobium sp.]HEX2840153.1 hypothetical protein [Hyphomicrobium sp.]